MAKMNFFFEDFTENNYSKLIKIAKSTYEFIFYDDYLRQGNLILWRHDIDESVQRAFRLATIESELGVKATYFVHLHSIFYNPLDEDNSILIQKIIDLGHNIGLHFDPSYYHQTKTKLKEYKKYIKFEKEILEGFFDIKIKVVSLHNPDPIILQKYTKPEICGMINTYSTNIKNTYGYCSDSNGYWRYERLEDILVSKKFTKLQILTHPGWWTPEVMSPRERISRCINGRSKRTHFIYDQILERHNRDNIR